MSNSSQCDLPVNDLHGMAKDNSLQNLTHYASHSLLCQRDLARQVVEQLSVLAQFEYQEDEGVAFVNVMQCDDVRVPV